MVQALTPGPEGRACCEQGFRHIAIDSGSADNVIVRVLPFRIGRHVAMDVGSTRAELKNWHVDLDLRIAQCGRSRSYRQRCRIRKESG